ncbi:hypothetical protein FPK50_25510, partial [Acinetobacter baumannii]|nr:hypothetical protein [Acinetobacter baumannii]
MMRHGDDFPGSAVEQHEWALKARQIWHARNNLNRLILERLTDAALSTRGEVLHKNEINNLMEIGDVEE